jgi:S-formylglutathione hydrolase
MGGHGTLKIAFSRPDQYLAIAALEPAIEPGFTRDQSPRRSQIYIAQGVSMELLGESASPALSEANSPAARLKQNADAIRASGMSIYLECGDNDALNLHDGTEFLHRTLWDLDISHEYHLVKDADHVGPSILERMSEAFRFLSQAIRDADKEAETQELSEAGRAYLAWSAAGMQGTPPPFDLMSNEGVSVLRAQFEDRRRMLAGKDPTFDRRYAVLPPSH